MFIPSTRGLGLPRFSFPPPRSPGSPWALWCSKDGPGPLSWVCCWPAFPIQVGAEVDPLSGADPGPWAGGQACSFITTPPVFLGLKWNFWSFLISRLSALFLIRNHLLSSGCTQIARYAGSQQTLKVRQNSRGHPGRVSPKHRPSGISDQQVPTIPWRSKKQGGEPIPSPLVKSFRTVSMLSLCCMMRGVYISSSCDQKPLLGTRETWDLAVLAEMLRPLPWPGHSRSRRQLSRRSSREEHGIREGGRQSACIPWSSGRWVQSKHTCVTGEARMSQRPQKEGQSWPRRHGNIAWEPELCSPSHPVAFCLLPAAHRPCDS